MDDGSAWLAPRPGDDGAVLLAAALVSPHGCPLRHVNLPTVKAKSNVLQPREAPFGLGIFLVHVQKLFIWRMIGSGLGRRSEGSKLLFDKGVWGIVRHNCYLVQAMKYHGNP